jgi:hypothetical protein
VAQRMRDHVHNPGVPLLLPHPLPLLLLLLLLGPLLRLSQLLELVGGASCGWASDVAIHRWLLQCSC